MFERPRRLKFYLDSVDKSLRAFGERSAVNTVVQGTGAEILKLALIQIWKHVLTNPLYRDKVSFRSTVHDEINFTVHKSVAQEIMSLIYKVMSFQFRGWPILMEVGVSAGTSWGTLFAWRAGEDGLWEPDFEREEKQDFGLYFV